MEPREKKRNLQKRTSESNFSSENPNLFREFGLILWVPFFFTSCLFPSPFPSPSEIHQSSEAEGGGSSSSRDRGFVSRGDRPSVADKPCRESSECPDICEKIFTRRTEKDECEEYSVSEVADFEKIYDFLTNNSNESAAQYAGNLRRIEEELLEDFVRISEELPTLLKESIDHGTHERTTFRNWIAENPGITEILRDRDEDLENENLTIFKAIFGENLGQLWFRLNQEGLLEDGETRRRLIKVAVRAGNRDFLQWIHENFMKYALCNTPSKLLENCYCALDLDSGDQRDYLEFRPLRDLLDQETPGFSPSDWKDGCS